MTNDTVRLIMERKSMRVFEDKPITEDIKAAILAAAMRAPTAGNSMLYSVIDVTDQTLKDKLAVSCDNQPFIAQAPLVLVFLADYRRWVRKFRQAGCEDIPNPRLGDLILSINDAVIAAQTAVITAESFGLGSCYIGDIIENWETHQKLMNLPQFTAPVSMLVVGHPTEKQKERVKTTRFPKEMVIFENTYHDLTETELDAYYENDKAAAFYNRKYISDFSVEMSRSAEEILKNWKGL